MRDLPAGVPVAELVPGRPEEVELLARRLDRFARSAGEAASRAVALDAAQWSGEGAELFRGAAGEVFEQLSVAAEAFAAAAGALTSYAHALRDAQTAAAQAVQVAEQAASSARPAGRARARQLLEQARAEVADAGRSAAVRLAAAVADAPDVLPVGFAAGRRPISVQAGDVRLRLVAKRQLATPQSFLGPLRNLPDSARFGVDHLVPFVGVAASTGWPEWVDQADDRAVGQIEPAAPLATDPGTRTGGAWSATAFARRGRGETAFGRLGLDDAEIRRRRERYAVLRHRQGLVGPARPTGLRSAAAWRTRLAAEPRGSATVHLWAGPEADPLPCAHRAEPIPLTPEGDEVRGVVLRNGPPGNEQRSGTGPSR